MDKINDMNEKLFSFKRHNSAGFSQRHSIAGRGGEAEKFHQGIGSAGDRDINPVPAYQVVGKPDGGASFLPGHAQC